MIRDTRSTSSHMPGSAETVNAEEIDSQSVVSHNTSNRVNSRSTSPNHSRREQSKLEE